MIHIKKRVISLILLLIMSFSFSACGNAVSSSDEVIELIDPVAVKVTTVKAEYRDVLEGKTYSAKVVPTTSDVYFSTNQSFLKYGALPGTKVKKGDTVLYASTKSLDDQIKALREKITSDEERYEEQLKDVTERYEDAKNWESYWHDVYDYILTHPDYELADAQTRMYQNALATYEQVSQELLKLTSLYELDSEYSALTLKRLTAQRKNVLASANQDGTVVSINYYGSGDWINKDQVVAAVGDLSKPVIACEYISKNDINKAERYFAIINGKEYEVEYIALDTEQYNQLVASNETAYSTFTFVDDFSDVTIGDYVSIVLVNKNKSGVLSVPSATITKDEQGTFVTVVNGEATSYVEVKIGETSGNYTEILSGLSEGDNILYETTNIKTKNIKSLSKGSVYHEFKATGYLYYPKREWVTNPIQYGVTYINEVLVKRYERVDKGQVIAKVSVVPNNIEIQRQERALLRANEDLQRFNDTYKNELNNQDSKILKQQSQKLERISDIEKYIADMKKDAATVEIKASMSGIVTSLVDFEEGSILNYDGRIIEISSEEDSFVVVEDENGQLTYGNVATITYTDSSNAEKTITGEVVTVSPDILNKSLKTGYALIKVSPEDLESMAGSSMGYEGWWNRSRFSISIKTRAMDNVVLVPKTAVTLGGDATYVSIPCGDGTSKLVSFISGGADASNYWVAEGLTEGTEICLE